MASRAANVQQHITYLTPIAVFLSLADFFARRLIPAAIIASPGLA